MSMKQVVRIILAAATIAALAAPAMAADKLIVMGTDGTTTKFKVDDTGKLTTTATNAYGTYLQEWKNDLTAGTTVRMGLRADGITYWQFNVGGVEKGQLMYTTPAGNPGVALYTGAWATPGVWANFGTYMGMYYTANANLPTLSVFTTATPEHGRVGIGQVAPTQKLEVNGGIRLNPTSVTTTVPNAATTVAPTQPICDVNARGTLWYLNNGAAKDNLQLCAYTGSAYAWTNIY